MKYALTKKGSSSLGFYSLFLMTLVLSDLVSTTKASAFSTFAEQPSGSDFQFIGVESDYNPDEHLQSYTTYLNAGKDGVWDNNTITFQTNASACGGLSGDTLNNLIDQALPYWNNILGSRLTILRGEVSRFKDENDAINYQDKFTPQILCKSSFGSDKDRVVAYTTAEMGADGRLSKAIIVINADSSGAASFLNKSESRKIQVLIHEIGHALGLGHSTTSDSMMYSTGRGSSSLTTAQDDADGINNLYSVSEEQKSKVTSNLVKSGSDNTSSKSGIFGCGMIAHASGSTHSTGVDTIQGFINMFGYLFSAWVLTRLFRPAKASNSKRNKNA